MKLGLVITTLVLLGACTSATNQTRGYAVRLKPGDDLRRTLEKYVADRQLR